MSDLVVQAIGLRKTYVTRRGRHVAVDGLDFSVPHGGVHGFLGPNGSGKTTTIRMLLGLSRADSGTMRLFGAEVPTRLPEVIGRIGAVVEQPRLFPAFSGRRNLELLGRTIGADAATIDAVLLSVGLSERAQDKYGGYSLGMRQRLAIAAALVKRPDLLVLDEPTNGLDPAGIREIRDLIRSLAAGGVTVLLSSHLLSEVQQVCDSVSIIGRGRLLAEDRVDVVLQRSGHATLRVGLADPAAGAAVLSESGLAVRHEGEHLLVDGTVDPAVVTQRLAERGLYVRELVPVAADLESAFLELTQGEGLQ